MSTEKPKDIIADELSILAIRYLNTTNERAKNKIFMQIAEYYMPKISKLISANPKWRNDILQIYYLQILKGLNNWGREKANISTYLYPYIIAVPRLFMEDKNMFKSFISCSFMDTELMGELFEDEEIWNRIIDSKFLHKLINDME